MQEYDFNDQIETDENNDIESTNSSKIMDIIGQTPYKLHIYINDDDFDNISLGIHSDTSNSNTEIEELDRIPTHVGLIMDFFLIKKV